MQILFGIHGSGYSAAQKLKDGEWRNATWAEYAKFLLENLYPINEEVVCWGMGYSLAELTTLAICSVPFGGLSSLGVGARECVIVAPATECYEGAAVTVAVSAGCRVVAAGRNIARLEALSAIYEKTWRFKMVV